MINYKIARMLDEIADLMEIKGENIYKINAYRKAARSINNFNNSIVDYYRSNDLEAIPGVGKGIAEKISEMIELGSSSELEALRAKVPPELREFLKIPGLGPKYVSLIFSELGITTLSQLKKAAEKGYIQKLPRMGEKIEKAIIEGIEKLHDKPQKTTIAEAFYITSYFKELLNNLPEVKKADIAGDLRRGVDEVENLVIVVVSLHPDVIIKTIKRNPQINTVLSINFNEASFQTWIGLILDLIVVTPDEYACALHYHTGSQAYLEKLNKYAHELGIDIRKINMIYLSEKNKMSTMESEEDIFTFLNLEYIPPELREGKNEIELASKKSLPRLISIDDIKGDLHLHTDWSDGIVGIEEIVRVGQEKSYEYLAVTDHSQSLRIAGGITYDKLLKQKKVISEINNRYYNIKVLSGIEVEILKDGALDFSDEILENLDIVIAAVHVNLNQSKDEMTERIIRAINNPHVDILAHPTSRITGKREAANLDFEAVVKAASRTDTALEINSSPDRLDIKDEYAAFAKNQGVKLVINTDAHDVKSLNDISFGVTIARRAGIEKNNVLNCLDLKNLLSWLKYRNTNDGR